LWLTFFAFTSFVALLIQLVVLPHVLPGLHGGNGLLVGGDWLQFHSMAATMAEQIHRDGWSAWELSPKGQAPAGVAAAIYALTVPQPWTLIPLNAALHATAGLTLVHICHLFVLNWRYATLCALPFVLYPSAMTWYTQIHKDGFSIAGLFLVLYSWILLARWAPHRLGMISVLAVLMNTLGLSLVSLVRPYLIQMLQPVSLMLTCLVLVSAIVRAFNKHQSWRSAGLRMVTAMLLVAVLPAFTTGGIEAETPLKAPSGSIVVNSAREDWHPTPLLPSVLDNKFLALASVRRDYCVGYPNAGSNIDVEVRFRRAVDIVAYIPRAAAIAFLAPFPSQWFGQGTLEANTTMRRISAFEMAGVYMTLPLLLLALWYWRRRADTWVLVIFCGSMMMVLGLVIPNVGTLYRLRYGFLMVFVAAAIAGGTMCLKTYLERRSSSTRSPAIAAQPECKDKG
jgi:hypothetical protein